MAKALEQAAVEAIQRYAKIQQANDFTSFGQHDAIVADLLTDVGNFLGVKLKWYSIVEDTNHG